MTTKPPKMAAPDISNLLGKITQKREELPPTERQHVTPISTDESKTVNTASGENVITEKGINVKEEINKNVNTAKRNAVKTAEEPAAIGRPRHLREGVTYAKLSPRIPKELKKRVDLALIHESIVDGNGRTIKTLDAVVEYALEYLLAKK